MALAHKRSLCFVLGGTSEESDAVSTTVSQQSRAVSARVSQVLACSTFFSCLFRLDLCARTRAQPCDHAEDTGVGPDGQGGARPLTGIGVLLEHKGLKRVGTVLGKSLLVGILVVQTHL